MKNPKQKEESGLTEIIALILLVILLSGSFGMQAYNLVSIQETNRLLSTFQRIDTVKGEWSNEKDGKITCSFNGKPCAERKSEDFHDPNTCYHWSSDCRGSKCNSVCHLNDESEGIE